MLSAVAFGQIKSLLVIYLGLQSYCVCLCVFMFECVLVAPAHTGSLINCVRALATFLSLSLTHTHTHTHTSWKEAQILTYWVYDMSKKLSSSTSCKCAVILCIELLAWQLAGLRSQIYSMNMKVKRNSCLKGLVHFPMKLSWSFTHPHVIQDVNVFLSSVEKKWRFLMKTFQDFSLYS